MSGLQTLLGVQVWDVVTSQGCRTLLSTQTWYIVTSRWQNPLGMVAGTWKNKCHWVHNLMLLPAYSIAITETKHLLQTSIDMGMKPANLA